MSQKIKENIGIENKNISRDKLEECIINSEEALSKELIQNNFHNKYDFM